MSAGSAGTLKRAEKEVGCPPAATGYQAKPEQRCPPHSSAGEAGRAGRRRGGAVQARGRAASASSARTGSIMPVVKRAQSGPARLKTEGTLCRALGRLGSFKERAGGGGKEGGAERGVPITHKRASEGEAGTLCAAACWI